MLVSFSRQIKARIFYSANQFISNTLSFIICWSRLHSGWSTNKSSVPLNASERERIIEVIQRNEIVEDAERQRVGRIIERVERIKQRAADCGPKFCR